MICLHAAIPCNYSELANDSKLRGNLKQVARQAVLEFDWEYIWQRLEQWYLESAYEERNP